ncbi:MAG: hypothetical protein HQ575_01855 [Candidatus Omnitrophica bacterium]|nr:hypothetical protein [Candidatus Omnitrophota bacterium]
MLLIHSCEIPKKYTDKLKEVLPDLISLSLPKNSDLYPSIASHPDIFFFRINTDTLIHSPSVPGKILDDIRSHNIRLKESQKTPSGNYPDTASLNCVRAGRYILHNTKLTDDIIKREADNLGLTLIHCGQGYSRCSVVPVNDKAIITSDPGITKAAKKEGIDTLLVGPGDIDLPGERYGFIGGASGILPDGTILFLGDIKLHPDYKKMAEFLKKHQAGYIGLPGLPLYDAGSLIFFVEAR